MTNEFEVFEVGDKVVTDFRDEMFLAQDDEGATTLWSLEEIIKLYNEAISRYKKEGE